MTITLDYGADFDTKIHASTLMYYCNFEKFKYLVPHSQNLNPQVDSGYKVDVNFDGKNSKFFGMLEE